MTRSYPAYEEGDTTAFWNTDGTILVQHGKPYEPDPAAGYDPVGVLSHMATLTSINVMPADLRAILDAVQADPTPREVFRMVRDHGMIRMTTTFVGVIDPDGRVVVENHNHGFAGFPRSATNVNRVALPYGEWVAILDGACETRDGFVSRCNIRPLVGVVERETATTAAGL